MVAFIPGEIEAGGGRVPYPTSVSWEVFEPGFELWWLGFYSLYKEPAVIGP